MKSEIDPYNISITIDNHDNNSQYIQVSYSVAAQNSNIPKFHTRPHTSSHSRDSPIPHFRVNHYSQYTAHTNTDIKLAAPITSMCSGQQGNWVGYRVIVDDLHHKILIPENS